MAAQNTGSAGGRREPSSPATPEKTTALMPAWTARASGSSAEGRARRSRRVAPTRESIAANGSAYAQAGAPPSRSPPTTSRTPPSPATNPANCRRLIDSPSSGTASVTATSGCRAVIRLLMPSTTPYSAAKKTPAR
ncbi:hypothetical protein SAMN04489713_101330 [Actinomadura madurae]|uniref:Uncharacterized protein n=1 Tax=Actinomadura madurae TaxID=1993 RepID=A0A1I4WHM7_9ACTN|nr:hypothetical protein SAMN04489713_101330 [Actinomadura madurae]SPT63142.1 Uncharacterised protein [Actinomadura madurae]